MKRQLAISIARACNLSPGSFPFPLKASGLCTIAGSAALLDMLVYQIIVETVLKSGRGAAYIDCGNAFNPYMVVRLCKRRGLRPESVLERIHISRPFTAFQLNTLMDGQLQSFLEESLPEIVVFSRISELFNSADVDARDSSVIFSRVAPEIRDVTRQLGVAGLITLARARKAQLSALIDASDTAMLLREEGGMMKLEMLKDPELKGRCFEFECSLVSGSQLTLHEFARDGDGQDHYNI